MFVADVKGNLLVKGTYVHDFPLKDGKRRLQRRKFEYGCRGYEPIRMIGEEFPEEGGLIRAAFLVNCGHVIYCPQHLNSRGVFLLNERRKTAA